MTALWSLLVVVVETEINSNDLCICLGTNKRSLFTARMNAKILGKRNIVVTHFEMGTYLSQQIQSINLTTGVKPIILYQHPSPSKSIKWTYQFSRSGFDSLYCLDIGYIYSVHIVYDYCEGKNCWDFQSLWSEFLSQCNIEMLHGHGIHHDKFVILNRKNIITSSLDTQKGLAGIAQERKFILHKHILIISFSLISLKNSYPIVCMESQSSICWYPFHHNQV